MRVRLPFEVNIQNFKTKGMAFLIGLVFGFIISGYLYFNNNVKIEFNKIPYPELNRVRIYSIKIYDSEVSPKGFVVSPGDKITLKIKNLTSSPKSFSIPDLNLKIDSISPNEEVDLKFSIPKPPKKVKTQYLFEIEEGEFKGFIFVNK